MLETILKHTDDEHVDRPRIEEALEAIEETLNSINESVRAEGDRAAMQKVKDGLVGKHDDFISPGRTLVRQGGMHQLGRTRAEGATRSTCGYVLIEICEGALPSALALENASLTHRQRAAHHAILCSDSLWFAEVLRGEKYIISHVFRFNDPVQPMCSALDEQGARGGSPGYSAPRARW